MSREKKKQLFWYQVDDGEAIARHLEKMARKGWLLEDVDNWCYHFRRSEPAEVRYAVTFFPDASVFDFGLAEGQDTYVEYCRAAGWELAAAYGPIQYFRTDRAEPIPIETDEAVKLKAVRRTMRKTFVFSHGLLLVLPAMHLLLAWDRFRTGPIEFFSSDLQIGLLLVMAGMVIFAGGMLLDYLIWVLRSIVAVRRGGSCLKPHTRFRLFLSAFGMMFCVAAVAFYVADAAWGGIFAVYTAVYGGVMVLSRWVLRRIKKSKTERASARALYAVYALAVGVVVGLGLPFLTVRLSNARIIHLGRQPAAVYTYEWGTTTFRRDIFRDPLPVTLEDLGFSVTEEDHCSYRADVDRTFLASHSEYTQEPLDFSSDLPRLYCQVYRTEWPWLLEQEWEYLMAEQRRMGDDWILEELDPGPWGAEEVRHPEGLNTYLLRYPTCIITVSLRGEEDAEEGQIRTVVLALGP